MSAYLTASPWVNLLPGVPTITGSSIPLTIDEVGTVIARVSAEMDGAMAQAGYSVPVPPPASGGPSVGYAQLEDLCGKGAGYEVLRAFFPNVGGTGDNRSVAGEYRTAYRQTLDMIREGKLPVVGATKSTGEEGRALARSYSTTNPDATAGVVPTFDMDWRP